MIFVYVKVLVSSRRLCVCYPDACLRVCLSISHHCTGSTGPRVGGFEEWSKSLDSSLKMSFAEVDRMYVVVVEPSKPKAQAIPSRPPIQPTIANSCVVGCVVYPGRYNEIKTTLSANAGNGKSAN